MNIKFSDPISELERIAAELGRRGDCILSLKMEAAIRAIWLGKSAPEGTPKLEELLKEFVANYARLNGVREQLATPKYDHYVEGASDFADEVERRLRPFITPAITPPNGKMEISTKEYGNLLAIWQTVVMLFSGPPNELPDVEAMRRRMHKLATPASTGEAQCERCERNAADNQALALISELVMGYREGSTNDIVDRVEYLVTLEPEESTGEANGPAEKKG